MNKIVNKFLLAGDKFLPEIHLKQPGFTCNICRSFTKNKDRIQKFKQKGDSRCIKQIFHAFLLNIRNYSPEVSKIQRREADLNIILPRVNNFNIKQKSAWNICYIIYPQYLAKSWVNSNKAK